MGYNRAFEANPTIWCVEITTFSLIIDESTNQTMEQHLICCCYLNLKGKGIYNCMICGTISNWGFYKEIYVLCSKELVEKFIVEY